MKRSLSVVALTCVAMVAGSYRLLKKYPLPGEGGWDYLTVDAAARRLYVPHGAQVQVVDLNSGR